ncbi:MAG: histidine kinase N-terminal 7TM domain-containing protein [Mycobacteriales bacterium]
MRRAALWAAAATAGLSVIVALWVLAGQLDTVPSAAAAGDVAVPALAAVSGVGVGVLLAARRPDNVIGWLLVVVGCAFSLGLVGEELGIRGLVVAPGSVPGAGAFAAVGGAVGAVALMPLALLALLFPTGRPPGPRWRVVAWASIAAPMFVVLSLLFDEHLQVPYRHVRLSARNPFFLGWQVPGVVYFGASALVAVAFLGGAGAVIARWRAARGQERQQLKVLASVFTAAVLCGLASAFPWRVVTHLDIVGAALLAAGVPVATAVAVLRYRLYDIDRLISRTLSYAAISLILVAGYAGLVVVLRQLLVPFTGEGNVAVAVSTLVMAAAFQPVRRRVQASVDRRFNRARYDAAGVVAEFQARLRSEVDLDNISADLLRAVRATVQPARVTLWLRTNAPRV